MSKIVFPVERAFATGCQGTTLVLMVCATWTWAGLYATPFSATPTHVAAASGHAVRMTPQQLLLGDGRFSLSPKSLQAALRWLDRQGVRVRATPTAARKRAISKVATA